MLTHFLHILEFGKKNIQNHLDLLRGRERQSEIVISVVTPLRGFVRVQYSLFLWQVRTTFPSTFGIWDPDSCLSKKKTRREKKGENKKMKNKKVFVFVPLSAFIPRSLITNAFSRF